MDWAGLLKHPLFTALVQLVVGALVTFLLTERWQRWRQRRDFQHRMLVKFSELSYEMMDRLSELLMWRGKTSVEFYTARRRECLSRWTVFVCTRGEVMAAYGRGFVRSTEYQELFNALNALRGHLNTGQIVPQERFEPDQEKFLAYREMVVAQMVRAMGLLSRRDWSAEIDTARTRVRAAEEAAGRMATPTPPAESAGTAISLTGKSPVG